MVKDDQFTFRLAKETKACMVETAREANMSAGFLVNLMLKLCLGVLRNALRVSGGAFNMEFMLSIVHEFEETIARKLASVEQSAQKQKNGGTTKNCKKSRAKQQANTASTAQVKRQTHAQRKLSIASMLQKLAFLKLWNFSPRLETENDNL